MVVMGDTCVKYHGHTHYYHATMLVIVTMAMVGMGVQSITAIRTTISNLWTFGVCLDLISKLYPELKHWSMY